MRTSSDMADLHENRQHGTPTFPFAMYRTCFQGYRKFSISWHWHEEIEFTLITRGSVGLGVKGEYIHLSAGEGAFINTGALHTTRQESREQAEMITAVFDPGMLAGANSVTERKYVLPVLACAGLDRVVLEPDVAWQNDILVILRELYSVSTRPHFGYELKLRELLARMWRRLAVNSRDKLEQGGLRSQDARIKKMMGYIGEHYGREVTLDAIAASANISARECCRCFHDTLGMTPIAYLLQYRVRVAAELLAQTDMPITDVCFATGFNNTSYFSKAFKQHIGQSPRAFRRSGQNSGAQPAPSAPGSILTCYPAALQSHERQV